MIDTTEIFLAINSIRKNEKKKPSKSNIYQHLQKEKHKELVYKRFEKVIENLLLSGTIFTKSDLNSFYISNDDIIIESFNNITLLPQDMNEKENKIRDLNHRLEILSEVSELKMNDINNQITGIHTALNNITSSYKAQNNCPKISSNQDTDEIKLFGEELKNKNTVIDTLLEAIFPNNKSFSSYEKLEDNYKHNVQRNQFETPKRYSFKNSNKTLGNEINITQNRYEVLSDSDENDNKGCNNDNDELSNNVTTSISSQQVNLRNNDIKKDQLKHKSKTKKRNEKGRSVTVVVGDSIVKKVKGWELSTEDYLFICCKIFSWCKNRCYGIMH